MIHHLLTDMHDKDREILDLKCQLKALKRRIFGRRSEKLDPNQLALFADLTEKLEAAEAAKAAGESESAPGGTDARPKTGNNGKKNGHGRKPLPADLPRERIEIPPSPEECICSRCNKDKSVIGEEVTEVLDYIPASFVVRQIVRPKLACKECEEGVVIADLPTRTVDTMYCSSLRGMASHRRASRWVVGPTHGGSFTTPDWTIVGGVRRCWR